MTDANPTANYCDCERGHNGFGMVGRLCDCQPPPTEANQTAASISPEAAIKWLVEAGRYFLRKDTHDEDAEYWANVNNAENCERIATLIARLSVMSAEAAPKP
jgi:hypothetical protein